MISHNDGRMMEIILKSGSGYLFGAARYVMQLEDLKEKATLLVDKVNNMEFPFKYTGTERPEDTLIEADYLVRAISEEQLKAEERFREILVRVFKDTREMQKKVFHEYLEVDYFDAYRITKDLKLRFSGDPKEESDEEILRKIVFIIDINNWFDAYDPDCFEEDDYYEEDEDEDFDYGFGEDEDDEYDDDEEFFGSEFKKDLADKLKDIPKGEPKNDHKDNTKRKSKSDSKDEHMDKETGNEDTGLKSVEEFVDEVLGVKKNICG